jgi:hypothetical protein
MNGVPKSRIGSDSPLLQSCTIGVDVFGCIQKRCLKPPILEQDAADFDKSAGIKPGSLHNSIL